MITMVKNTKTSDKKCHHWRIYIKNMVNLIFRYDDFSYDSNIKLEESLFRIFQKYKIPITIGVIPFRQNNFEIKDQKGLNISNKPEKKKILENGIDKKLIEIAQHGHSHFNYQKIPKAEFIGISLETQKKLISEGKFLIETFFNLNLKTFIPPWNRYDRNTIKLIEKFDFKNISAGTKGHFSEDSSLNFIPSTCSLNKFIEILNNQSINIFKNETLVILLHEIDFLDEKEKYEEKMKSFDLFLQNLTLNSNISYYLISEFTETEIFRKYKYKYYRIKRLLNIQLPKQLLNEKNHSTTLLTENEIKKTIVKIIIFYIPTISIPVFIISKTIFSFLLLSPSFLLNLFFIFSIFFAMICFSMIKKDKLYKLYLRASFIFIGILLSNLYLLVDL